MSDSVRPHRRQPTRLPSPWDSPGKNTGVGCHFLLQCMRVKSESEVAESCHSLRPHGLQPTRLLHPWDFPGKSTGVGCHCLLHLEMHSGLNHISDKSLQGTGSSLVIFLKIFQQASSQLNTLPTFLKREKTAKDLRKIHTENNR